MAKYLLTRLSYTLPSFAGVLVLCFVLARLSGDPTNLLMPPEATAEARQAFRTLHGLDGSLWEQFVAFVGNILRGNLGTSIRLGVPVTDLIAERIGASLELAIVTLVIALAIGVPAGVAAAYFEKTPLDLGIRGVAVAAQAIPTFYLAVASIFFFSVSLGWLPSSGRGGLQHLVLPAVTLSLTMVALIARVTRSSMLEVKQQDYIRTAYAKGLSERVIVGRHMLRNAMLPVVTVVSLQLGTLMGGVIVTETVFSWPGVGRLAIQAINGRDYPVVQGVVLFFAFVFVAVNLLADILYLVLDPRVRQR